MEAIMTLFTKAHCQKCHYIKGKFDLTVLGIQEEILGEDNPEALAHLAWHELVETAQKELPILILDDSSAVIGAIPIKKYLLGQPTARPH
jgi:glutaredoxin 2